MYVRYIQGDSPQMQPPFFISIFIQILNSETFQYMKC